MSGTSQQKPMRRDTLEMAQGRQQQQLRSNPQHSTTMPTEQGYQSTPQPRTHGSTISFTDSQQTASPWQQNLQPQSSGSRRHQAGGTSSNAFHLDDSQDKAPHIAITLPNLSPSQPIPNILIFGETGIGKSSLINMVAGRDIAVVSSDALGCTFGSTGYEVLLDDTPIRLWDTAGLNEGERGNVPAEVAMKNLQELVSGLRDGLSLLVYVVRGTRFRDILEANYELFARIICQSRVPVVVVITGLEHEDPMENWWVVNGGEFRKRGLHITDHACVTTFRGKKVGIGGYMFEDEFEDSQILVRKLIKDNFLPTPWVTDKKTWMRDITQNLATYYKEQMEKAEEAAGLRRDGGSSRSRAGERTSSRALPNQGGHNQGGHMDNVGAGNPLMTFARGAMRVLGVLTWVMQQVGGGGGRAQQGPDGAYH